MNRSREERLEELMKEILMMSEEERRAIAWIAHNYDFAAALCGQAEMSAETRRKHTDKALKNDDALGLGLLALEKVLHHVKADDHETQSRAHG